MFRVWDKFGSVFKIYFSFKAYYVNWPNTFFHLETFTFFILKVCFWICPLFECPVFRYCIHNKDDLLASFRFCSCDLFIHSFFHIFIQQVFKSNQTLTSNLVWQCNNSKSKIGFCCCFGPRSCHIWYRNKLVSYVKQSSFLP